MARTRYSDISVRPVIFHYQGQRPIDWSQDFGTKKPLDVEVGFGLGEFLLQMADECPDRNFVGIEQDWERVKKTLRKIGLRYQTTGVDNIRLLLVDATVALERLFEPLTIHRLFCLFPCPWPKKGHIKYRLFSENFFKLVNSRLIPEGEVRIVTDAVRYYEWVLEQIPSTGFKTTTRTIGPRFDTKYEKKWVQGGQKEFYEIALVKQGHIPVPVLEDRALKVYFAKRFNPDRFEFDAVVSDMTIALKDFMFDAERKKAMVHLVVAEKTITQHLWVMVAHSAKGWRVSKAEGHTVLPTRGVAEAIRCVYEEVERTGLSPAGQEGA